MNVCYVSSGHYTPRPQPDGPPLPPRDHGTHSSRSPTATLVRVEAHSSGDFPTEAPPYRVPTLGLHTEA